MTSAICPAIGAVDRTRRRRGGRARVDSVVEVGVAGEDRLALARGSRAYTDEVGEHASSCDFASAFARVRCSGHERVERGAVDREARLLGDLEGEVDREAVGVVQQERRRRPRARSLPALLRRRHRGVEDRSMPAASVRRNVSSSAYASCSMRA